MPYELDYKKVHNTLKPRKLDNAYGYLQGQVANLLKLTTVEIGGESFNNVAKAPLTSYNQQFVIQNESLDRIDIDVYIITENGMTVLIEDDPSSMRIDFGHSILIEVPTNEAVYQLRSGDFFELHPAYVVFVATTELPTWSC